VLVLALHTRTAEPLSAPAARRVHEGVARMIGTPAVGPWLINGGLAPKP
jgi:hypothetical protein